MAGQYGESIYLANYSSDYEVENRSKEKQVTKFFCCVTVGQNRNKDAGERVET